MERQLDIAIRIFGNQVDSSSQAISRIFLFCIWAGTTTEQSRYLLPPPPVCSGNAFDRERHGKRLEIRYILGRYS